MVGAWAGGGSGAGIRFWKIGVWGVRGPNSVGFRVKAPRLLNPWIDPAPLPKPPRAKLAVGPKTQTTANTAAKTRFMIAFLLLLCLPHARNLIIQQETTLSVLPRLTGLAVFDPAIRGARHPGRPGAGCHIGSPDRTCCLMTAWSAAKSRGVRYLNAYVRNIGERPG